MEMESFLKGLDDIRDIPTLPVVVVKVNKMLDDLNVTAKQLSDTIEKDQALVARLLKLVNSAFYGFQAQINSIAHTITILGFNTVRNTIISASVIKSFSGRDLLDGFNIVGFWQHSVAVAVTARFLAKQNRLCTPDEAFVSGILHDVGKVVLAQYYQDPFKEILSLMKEQALSFNEAEIKLLPATHAQIGGYMAEKWQLPANLVDTVTHHHFFEGATDDLNPMFILYMADFIVNNYCSNSKDEKTYFSCMDPAVESIFTKELETISDWFPKVQEDIDTACQFFLEEVR